MDILPDRSVTFYSQIVQDQIYLRDYWLDLQIHLLWCNI